MKTKQKKQEPNPQPEFVNYDPDGKYPPLPMRSVKDVHKSTMTGSMSFYQMNNGNIQVFMKRKLSDNTYAVLKFALNPVAFVLFRDALNELHETYLHNFRNIS